MIVNSNYMRKDELQNERNKNRRRSRVCDSPGKQRVTLEYGQAVPYALTDTAFLGSFQPLLDFLNALGWLHGVHGVF